MGAEPERWGLDGPGDEFIDSKEEDKVIRRPRAWGASALQGEIKLNYAIKCRPRQGSGAGNMALAGSHEPLDNREPHMG
jgi:hypothetical protein